MLKFNRLLERQCYACTLHVGFILSVRYPKSYIFVYVHVHDKLHVRTIFWMPVCTGVCNVRLGMIQDVSF